MHESYLRQKELFLKVELKAKEWFVKTRTKALGKGMIREDTNHGIKSHIITALVRVFTNQLNTINIFYNNYFSFKNA